MMHQNIIMLEFMLPTSSMYTDFEDKNQRYLDKNLGFVNLQIQIAYCYNLQCISGLVMSTDLVYNRYQSSSAMTYRPHTGAIAISYAGNDLMIT